MSQNNRVSSTVHNDTCIDHGKKGSTYGYTTTNISKTTTTGLHRVVYCEANGLTIADIKGKVVRHTCDNPRCINPAHLLIGTQWDNIQDAIKRGRKTDPPKHIGETHPLSKLTKEDIAYIRLNYKPRCRAYGGGALARKFGVSRVLICKVVRGDLWQHL